MTLFPSLLDTLLVFVVEVIKAIKLIGVVERLLGVGQDASGDASPMAPLAV